VNEQIEDFVAGFAPSVNVTEPTVPIFYFRCESFLNVKAETDTLMLGAVMCPKNWVYPIFAETQQSPFIVQLLPDLPEFFAGSRSKYAPC
jgi:hypothetical protein